MGSTLGAPLQQIQLCYMDFKFKFLYAVLRGIGGCFQNSYCVWPVSVKRFYSNIIWNVKKPNLMQHVYYFFNFNNINYYSLKLQLLYKSVFVIAKKIHVL